MTPSTYLTPSVRLLLGTGANVVRLSANQSCVWMLKRHSVPGAGRGMEVSYHLKPGGSSDSLRPASQALMMRACSSSAATSAWPELLYTSSSCCHASSAVCSKLLQWRQQAERRQQRRRRVCEHVGARSITLGQQAMRMHSVSSSSSAGPALTLTHPRPNKL